MISAGDFKNGLTLEIDGNVVQIMEFQHVKPGKGAALRRHSVPQKNSRQHVSNVLICPICILTETFTTS